MQALVAPATPGLEEMLMTVPAGLLIAARVARAMTVRVVPSTTVQVEMLTAGRAARGMTAQVGLRTTGLEGLLTLDPEEPVMTALADHAIPGRAARASDVLRSADAPL